MTLRATTETLTKGSPVRYNDGTLYDDKYYNRWYDVGGVVTQGETPTFTIKNE